MSPVQSFAARYDKVVSETLDAISSPTQMVSYGVNTSLAEVKCHDDDEFYHHMPAVSVYWSVEEGEIYDIAYFQLPLIPEPVTEVEMQAKIAEAWAEMVFARQASDMADLDDEMDALAEGEDRSL